MTYEKGSSEVYGKQVYDHYLAMDATKNITSDQKVRCSTGWVRAVGRGAPAGRRVPAAAEQARQPAAHADLAAARTPTSAATSSARTSSAGDTARLMRELIEHRRARLPARTADAIVDGVHPFGKSDPGRRRQTLPAGTLYVPMAQGQKHWIQAILGEDPYLPYPVQLRRHAVVVPAHARHRRQRLPDAAVAAGRRR